MSIDVSGSMLYGADIDMPVELGKNTARLLASLIPIPPSEFAVQTCNDQAYLVQDFTSIKSRIISAIDPINANGDNDFVEQLLNPKTGLLNIAKTGKYKRVAVLYTDAWWASLGPDELQQCKDTCSKYDIQFYAIIYSRPEAEPNGIKQSLQELANFTGGKLYDGVTNQQAAEELSYRLQQDAQGNQPCRIEWQSGLSCFSTNDKR